MSLHRLSTCTISQKPLLLPISSPYFSGGSLHHVLELTPQQVKYWRSRSLAWKFACLWNLWMYFESDYPLPFHPHYYLLLLSAPFILLVVFPFFFRDLKYSFGNNKTLIFIDRGVAFFLCSLGFIALKFRWTDKGMA